MANATRSVHSLKHEPNFRAAVKSINTAVQHALKKSTYSDAAVLALSWENDDLNLGPITQEFLNTFRSVLGFKTDNYVIPATSKHDAVLGLKGKIRDFRQEYDGEDCLLVVVYEGHSGFSPASGLEILGSLSDRRAPSIPWVVVEYEFFDFNADLLFIMDCYASIAAAGPESGNFEYLVASAQESMASPIVETSFSRRLIDILLSLEEPVTVAQVHEILVNQANDPRSRLDYTPVHVVRASKPSITLSPVIRVPRELKGLRRDRDHSDGKVLVSVLVRGKTTIPDIVQWKKWLAQEIPSDVADIQVEAVFDSHSALCLLTLPIAVWDMAKNNEAFSFIAFVESSNLMNSDAFNAVSTSILESRSGNVAIRPGRK